MKNQTPPFNSMELSEQIQALLQLQVMLSTRAGTVARRIESEKKSAWRIESSIGSIAKTLAELHRQLMLLDVEVHRKQLKDQRKSSEESVKNKGETSE